MIYFDPFEIETVSKDADIIFVTHDHYDHFDPKSIEAITNDKTIIVAPKSIEKRVIAKSGISENRCVFMEPHTVDTVDGLKIEAIPAYNKMKPFHVKGKKFLGYVVTLDDVRYYVAGDTDLNEDIVTVKCDVALLPIGGTYTMDKAQAAELVNKIRPTLVIPTHYGSVIGKKDEGAKFTSLVEQLGIGTLAEVKVL